MALKIRAPRKIENRTDRMQLTVRRRPHGAPATEAVGVGDYSPLIAIPKR
jgi:hypothetical protein